MYFAYGERRPTILKRRISAWPRSSTARPCREKSGYGPLFPPSCTTSSASRSRPRHRRRSGKGRTVGARRGQRRDGPRRRRFKLQSLGMTFQKAEYITDFAEKVHTGAFDLEGIWQKSDEEASGSFRPSRHRRVDGGDDFALLHAAAGRVELRRPCHPAGLRMVYHHRKIDRGLFEKYRRRFSPLRRVASLYLWAVSGGAIPELHDYAPKKKMRRGR